MGKWTRIERLFHAAMDKPNERRSAYLRVAANNDVEFEECLKLVKAAEAADDFMSTSIGLAPFVPSLQNDDVIGNWRIEKVIGSGGMGEVYLVQRKVGDFNHTAALKLARTKDHKYLARFEQERQILAKLEHANIGRLIDGGVNEKGQPYFVMEWVDGQRITKFAQTRNLKQFKKLKLFKQLCHALSHAHSRLVLHRDIKPANVLVSEDGQVKLIDFGVSYDLSLDDQSESAPTTTAYAAPEQITGGQVTTATDIYALGGLLHELLTGKRLRRGTNVSLGLPEDLRHIITKCHETAPADRYEAVGALWADIRRFEKSEPIEARSGGWPYRTTKFLSRYKLAAGLTALLVFSLMAGLGGTLSMLKHAQSSEKLAIAAQLDEEYEARVADGYRIGLQTLYGEDKAPEDKIDPRLIDKSVLNMALKTKKNFDSTNLDDAFLLFSMGKHFKYREDFENAVLLLSPLENIPLTTPIMAYLSIESRSELARSLIQVNKKERAEKIARQLLIDRQAHHLTNTQTHIQDAQSIAKVTGDIRDQNYVIELTKQSINIELQKIEPPNSSNLEFFYNQLAFTLYRRGQIMESLEFFEKSFEMQRKQGIRFLDDAAAPTNLAQFQIYLAQDGVKPEKYLPDYLSITSGEQGSPTLYSLVQGLRTEAALLTERWDLAEETSRLAMARIEDNKAYRVGWYYEIAAARIRALTRLSRYGEARALLAPTLDALSKEDIVSRWEFKECRLYLAESYLTAFEGSKEKATLMFDKAEAMCKAAAPRAWSKETITQNLINRMRQDIEKDRR